MKLYYSRGACSLGVRITINELGIECEYESVNIKNKLTETEKDYLLINPKGAVPALLINNKEILTENVAIQIYLAEKFNGTKLLPKTDDMKRYRVFEWLSFISTDIHKSFGGLFNPNIKDDIKETVFKPILKNKLSLVERHLMKQKYLVGDDFTLADSYMFVMLSWLKGVKLDVHHWPTVSKYFDELKKRPSVIKSLQQEGLIDTAKA